MKKLKYKNKNFVVPILISLISVISLLAGFRLKESLQDDGLMRRAEPRPTQAIDEALRHIRAKYYGPMDDNVMTDAILTEMFKHLDPYSDYFRDDVDRRFNHFIDGTFDGLGFEFFRFQDTTYILSVVPSSPADQVGLHRGAVLKSINGINLFEKAIDRDSIRSLCIRPPGDTVLFQWASALTYRDTAAHLVISNVSSPLVTSYLLEDSTTLYVHIERFSNNSFRKFMEAIDRFGIVGVDIQALIIDVRDNPGGVLTETVKMLNQLITAKNAILTTTVDNDGEEFSYKSNGRGFLNIDKIAVLINNRSASASEILAGVLQDYDRAIVLGSPSYGKGLVQQNYDLVNKGSINLTVGEYVLPSGRRISRETPLTTSDTTQFATLVLGRRLRDRGGIVPDIAIDEDYCLQNVRRQLSQDMWKAVIESGYHLPTFLNGGYDEGMIESLADFVLQNYQPKDGCDRLLARTVRWDYWRYVYPDTKLVKPAVMDSVIHSAYDIIQVEDLTSMLRPTLE